MLKKYNNFAKMTNNMEKRVLIFLLQQSWKTYFKVNFTELSTTPCIISTVAHVGFEKMALTITF